MKDVGARDPANIQLPERVSQKSVLWKAIELTEPPYYLVADDTTHNDFLTGRSARKEEIKSALAILLRAGGHKVGVMFINYRTHHHFELDERDDARLFADQAAVAIRNAQLHTETGKRAEALQGLYDTGMAITGPLSLEKTRDEIARQALRIVGVSHQLEGCYSHVALREGDKLRFVAANTQEILEKLWQGLGEINLNSSRIGIVGRTVKTGQPQLIGDVSNDSDYTHFGVDVHSRLSVPMKVGEHVIGVISVGHPDTFVFSFSYPPMVELLAAQAAAAIHNAQLYHEAQDGRAYFMRAQKAARAVAETSAKGELEATMQVIVEGAQTVLRCDLVTVYAFDEEKRRFTHMREVGHKDRTQIRPPEAVTKDSVLWKAIELTASPYYLVADDTTHNNFLMGRSARAEGIKSALAILLRASGRRVGVMFINYRSDHHFEPDELDDAGLFADQAAVAIRNAQLHTETGKRAEALQGLYNAGMAITGPLSLEKTFNAIARQALRIVGVSHQLEGCYSHVALREGDKLRFEAASTPEVLEKLREEIREIDLKTSPRIGIVGRAVKIGQTQLIGDASSDPDHTYFGGNVRSRLSVPIRVGDQVIGAISIGHPEPNVFTLEDQQNVELLAAQAGIAIHNAWLYQEEQKGQAYLESLYRASGQILSPRNIEEVSQEIVDSVCGGIKARQAIVYVLDDQGALLLLARSGGEYHKDSVRDIRMDGVSVYVLGCGQPYFISDVNDSTLPICPNPNMIREGIKAGACLPMPLKGKCIGVLWVEFEEVHSFKEAECKALLLFATQSAIAYDNARQYQELRRTKGRVGTRTALAWMGMTSTVWRHSIQGYAITIQDLVKKIRSDLQKKNLASTEGRLIEIEDLSRKIIDRPITLPLSEEEHVESVAINDLLRERIKQLWKHALFKVVDYELKLNLEENNSIRVSSEWFKRALDVLIENAVEAMRETKVKHLSVETCRVNGFVEIILTDTGRGIPDDTLAKLFQEPIKKPKGSKGLGMGLLMAQCIVQTYSGEIKVDKTGPQGTRLIMRFPLEV